MDLQVLLEQLDCKVRLVQLAVKEFQVLRVQLARKVIRDQTDQMVFLDQWEVQALRVQLVQQVLSVRQERLECKVLSEQLDQRVRLVFLVAKVL